MRKVKVLLSAGHSDIDPGAVAVVEFNQGGRVTKWTVSEAEIVTKYRDAIGDELKGNPEIDIVLDRDDTHKNLPLKKAIALARQADIAIEFHMNAARNPSASGVECFSLSRHKEFSKSLCDAIYNASNKMIKPRGGDGGFKDESASQHRRLGFVSTGGGLIMELGFLSNTSDRISIYPAFEVNKIVVTALANTILKQVKKVLDKQK